MRCIGGISILFVIYWMWWNLNLAYNIFYQIYYIYSLFIFCFSSVMGKRRGLTNPGRLCYGQETRPNEPASPLLRARDEDCRGWAWCGGLSIRHLALQRQWWCRRWRHREGVHEAGRGRRQYDVKMAEQRRVFAFAREGARALHYSTWRIWGEPLQPPAQVRGDQPCAGTGGGCGVEKWWLQISLFCGEDCRLHCEMVKFTQSIGREN
jgi:hypothetical protein